MEINPDKSDLELKKKYIFENISKIKNHTNYLDIIKLHECPHTVNLNGIFINLNTIVDEAVDKLYYKLKNDIENDDFNTNIIEKQFMENEIENLLKENTNVVVDEVYDIIKMDEFSEHDKKIIELSKKYKI